MTTSASNSASAPLLVTGAAGFIGARFVESCNRRGIPVISVDHPDYFRTRQENRALDFGRIIDRETLFKQLEQEKIPLSGIMHLGACADTTQLDEKYLAKMNTEYSKRLWEFASERKLPLVYASSAATYGDGTLGYDDNEAKMSALRPLNPYGQSKLDFDLWAIEAERKGMHPPTWSGFKFFNVYGFGERHKGKMASVALHAFDQIRANGRVKLFKSHRKDIEHGHQKRDFIFVQDVIDVLWFAREKPLARGIYNLGTGQARTFLDLVRAVFKALGKPENIEFIDTPVEIRERYQYFTEARMQKLRSAGYSRAFTSLENGVAPYVEKLSLNSK